MGKNKLSAYNLLQLKGKRQLSVGFVNNPAEAAAAEEAGFDILATSYDAPQFDPDASTASARVCRIDDTQSRV